MKTLCSMLMVTGLVLALGGVVAVFNFDQPSDMFSLAWWMIVGGWSLVLVGMSIDILQLFQVVMPKTTFTFQREVESGSRAEQDVTRI